MKKGFDNDKYLLMQSQHIRERIAQFDNKLYLEFGGKLFDDYHASRVLPGFQPDSKLQMLLQLKEQAEIVIVISAEDIISSKVRGDYGITYDLDVLRLIDAFQEMGLYVGSVCVTKYTAAAEVEATLGAIDVWINNAMTTVLAPFRQMSEEEFRRVTEVTYLGYVNGTRAALEVMAPRDRGVIIQAGSALAWRSIPLQSAYCGAKAAIRGFTDAVRTELMHEKSHIQLTMVQLPGMNTAQFGWARNKMDQAMQPVPPVYQPEVAAEAIYSVIQRPVNELWVGKSTIQSILGQVFFPRLLDRLMVKKAWEGQFTGQPKPAEHQDDLFTPVRGNHPGHGPFNDGARRKAVTISADLPGKVAAGVGVAVATMALRALFRRSGKRR